MGSVIKPHLAILHHAAFCPSQEAAERYARLEREQNWLARYPLRYLSSFIGITQSSLSRLRAKKR